MSEIVEKIKGIAKLYHATGCTAEQIEEAQNSLGILFPAEFIDYVLEYGAVSFFGTEWTGLNVDGYLNVVEATKQEREGNAAFPGDCFVLENIGMEGLLTIVNEKGQVFSFQSGKKQNLCNSMFEYLDVCKARQS